MKKYNFKVKVIEHEDSKRVDFQIDCLGNILEYHTNNSGNGLFTYTKYGTEIQLVGTCDFHARQETRQGKKAAFIRWWCS